MSILGKHIAFVNGQVAVQLKLAAKFSEQPNRQQLHLRSGERFKALATDLVEAEKLLDELGAKAISKPTAPLLSLTPEDIEGLPEELIKELSISDGDRTEFAILNLLEEAGGLLSLDRILIGLYKRTGEIHKRPSLVSRLYRMSQKGLLFPVPNKKGLYSSREVGEEATSDTTETLGGRPT